MPDLNISTGSGESSKVENLNLQLIRLFTSKIILSHKTLPGIFILQIDTLRHIKLNGLAYVTLCVERWRWDSDPVLASLTANLLFLQKSPTSSTPVLVSLVPSPPSLKFFEGTSKSSSGLSPTATSSVAVLLLS